MDLSKTKLIFKEIHTVIQKDPVHFRNKKLKIADQKRNNKYLTMISKM